MCVAWSTRCECYFSLFEGGRRASCVCCVAVCCVAVCCVWVGSWVVHARGRDGRNTALGGTLDVICICLRKPKRKDEEMILEYIVRKYDLFSKNHE